MKKAIKFIVIGIVVLVIIGSFMDSGEKDAVNPNLDAKNGVSQSDQPKPKEEPKPSYIVGPGTHKVGSDIPAGEYMIVADGMGYVELAKDSNGTLESIITNDNFSINRYITVNDGEYLKLNRCSLYDIGEAPKFDRMEMYKIGLDLPAGEYKLTSEGSYAYVEVSKNSRGELDSIITNDNFTGSTYITVKDGQYLKMNNAYIER